MLAEANAKERAAVTRFGTIIGLAFQLADDLLDVTSTSAQLGKTAGKDQKAKKATLVSLHGIEATRAELNTLITEAESLLAPFGRSGRYAYRNGPLHRNAQKLTKNSIGSKRRQGYGPQSDRAEALFDIVQHHLMEILCNLGAA